MKKVYYASPLFSEMERRYNTHIVSELREHYPSLDIYVPQEQLEINDKQAYADSKMIAHFDTEALLASELVIAVLDGSTIDVGVASEIGVAYAKGIPIIGVYTDTRQQGGDNSQKIAALMEIGENQFHYANLYTVGLVKMNGIIVGSEEELLVEVGNYIQK